MSIGDLPELKNPAEIAAYGEGVSTVATMRPGRKGPFRKHAAPVAVITDAKEGRSSDLSKRERRYIIAMIFRVFCFLIMAFLPGWWKVAPIVFAAILPGVAVLVGNAVDRRSATGQPLPTVPQEYHKALPMKSTEVLTGEVID